MNQNNTLDCKVYNFLQELSGEKVSNNETKKKVITTENTFELLVKVTRHTKWQSLNPASMR